MNILFINNFFVGFVVSEIPRVSVFGYCPYSVTFTYMLSFGGKKMLTIIAYINIIFSKVSLGNYLLKYRSTKVELAGIYKNINFTFIIIYLEFLKIHFNIFLFIFCNIDGLN